jgi:hypothetical protein
MGEFGTFVTLKLFSGALFKFENLESNTINKTFPYLTILCPITLTNVDVDDDMDQQFFFYPYLRSLPLSRLESQSFPLFWRSTTILDEDVALNGFIYCFIVHTSSRENIVLMM